MGSRKINKMLLKASEVAMKKHFRLVPGNYGGIAPDDISVISTSEYSFGIVDGDIYANIVPLKKGTVYCINGQEVIVNPFVGGDSDDGINTPMFIRL